MITVIFCSIVVCILFSIATKEFGGGFFGFIVGCIIGLVIALCIPSDTKVEVKTYPLEKIGNTYLQDDGANYIVAYNSQVNIISKESKPNIKIGNEYSITVETEKLLETDLNLFSICNTYTEYTITLKTAP